MAAIDLLFDVKLASERLHQLALGAALTRSSLLARLGIDGDPGHDEWEPRRGLFDLAVSLNDGEGQQPDEVRRVWIELKIDAGLGRDQLEKQLKHVEGSTDHVAYLLLGTAALHSVSAELRTRVEEHRRRDGALGLVLTSQELEEGLWSAARELGTDREARDVRDLLTSYRDALIRLRERVEGFEDTPLEQWGYGEYLGFFAEWRRRTPSASDNAWIGYVHGPKGGFIAAAWQWTELPVEGLKHAYLQWEGEFGDARRLKLCFKIEVNGEHRQRAGTLRDCVHREVVAAATRLGVSARKPDKFGTGRTMTVAVLDELPLADAPDREIQWARIAETAERAVRILDVVRERGISC